MNELIKKAKEREPKRTIKEGSQEHWELLCAHLRGEVTFTGAREALGKTNNVTVYTWAMKTLRWAYENGKIKD